MPLARRVLAERVDPAVAEVADEEASREAPEIGGCHGEAPRRGEQPAIADAGDEVAVGVELANETVADPGNVVLAALQGVCDEDRVADHLDSEGAETLMNAGVREAAGGFDLLERAVEEVALV